MADCGSGCSALLKGKVSSVVVCCEYVCACGALLEADAPLTCN